MTLPHSFPFDPTYQYDLPALLQVPSPPPPPDFASFWQDTFAQVQRIPLDIELTELPRREDQQRVFEVQYTGLDGFRVGAWIRLPRTPVQRGMVVSHGYGGREGPDLWIPGPPAVAIFPCARGFNRSARPDLPKEANAHVLHGIAAKETYIHRHCAADLWSAASVLAELYPQTAACLDYLGISFGGGIGALALPWDSRFRKAFLGVPSFGNHPLRVTLDCVGSGSAIRQLYLQNPAVLQVLRYFDSASAARSIRIPTAVVAALFDPAVPPPGQFAVFNALAGPKQLIVRQADHFEYAASDTEWQMLNNTLDAWFHLP
ncbi:MAG: acetylxylan esterase [Phycisphaeraceae bacterium]|nr:acetylxylan esterase [Phycisphaeraceae bacterium]